MSNYIDAAIGKGQTVISEEVLKEKQANRTGENIEMPTRERDSSHPSEGRLNKKVHNLIYKNIHAYLQIHTTAARGSGSRTTGMEVSTEANPNRRKGMVLPFVPLSLTFDNVKYSVDMPQVCSSSNISCNFTY